MALCLAESLLHYRGFNARDQMDRYQRWYRDGYLSSTGKCFDIGGTVSSAIHAFERTGEPYSGSSDPQTAGNGSIMRLAPIPMFYAFEPEKAVHFAAESSRTTHATQAALDACRYFAGLIVGALNDQDKQTILASDYSPVSQLSSHRYCDEMKSVAGGSFKEKQPPEIRGTGYVVKSLEAALWALYESSTFKEGALLAVNLGDDADTTGAVYGQLAGALYGVEAIPPEWREKLAMKDLIEEAAQSLFQSASEHTESGSS
jgi:ADP-ribosyl-[dinitrogen reductase] hydrolase